MPVTIGISLRTIADTTASSLKAHKSSMPPPPLHKIKTSTCARLFAVSKTAAIFSAASAPCAGALYKVARADGKRFASTAKTSRTAAPASEPTTPTCDGKNGNFFLRATSNQPRAVHSRLRSINN